MTLDKPTHNIHLNGEFRLVKYLQTWVADQISRQIKLAIINKPTNQALRSATTLMGSYIIMRTKYAIAHNWPLDSTNTDIDTYDINPKTYYFLAAKKRVCRRSKLLSGLRLTQIMSFEDSLSMLMWADAVDKQELLTQLLTHKQDVALLKKLAKKGNVWDLTRLVTDLSLKQKRHNKKDKRLTYAALLLSLGVALKHTGSDALWIFTCNKEIVRFLNRLDIQFTIIVKGQISKADPDKSYFGWTSAKAAYDQLISNKNVVGYIANKGFKRQIPIHSS